MFLLPSYSVKADQLPLRKILLPVLLSGSTFTLRMPAWANSSAILIENQAVGSFLDPVNSNTPQQVESNTVNQVELEPPTETNDSTNLTPSEDRASIKNQAENMSSSQ